MAKEISQNLKRATKKDLAKELGLARSSLYYQPKRPGRDKEVKVQIEKTLSDHPAYGHKRIALALKLNKKRILRVMKKFHLKPYRRRIKRLRKIGDEGRLPALFKNEIKNLCPLAENVIWVMDFTFLRYQNIFIYLATVMDLYTRKVVGWNIRRFHHKELVLGAFNDALKRTGRKPLYAHSDQGSEYDSQDFINLLQSSGIIISMSAKSSPWENPYQESFYSQFKLDLGDPNRFESLAELIEGIHLTINYYNRERIHTALKMAPEEFALKSRRDSEKIVSDVLSDVWGT